MTTPIGYPEQFGMLVQPNRMPGTEQPTVIQPGRIGTDPPVNADNEKILGPKFAEQLAQFVNGVDQTQKGAQNKAEEFAVGHQNDIHGTMIAVEQAEISLHLLANVRNRVVDLYREVMRMGS